MYFLKRVTSFLPQMLIVCISANVHNVKSACSKCRVRMQACSLLHYSLIAVSVSR